MFLKLVVYATFAATLVQSKYPPLAANPQVVADAFKGYIGLIRNAIDWASETLAISRVNIHQLVEPTTRQIQTTLKAESSNLLEENHVLIQEAKLSEVQLNVCISNSEQRIMDVPMRFDKEILKCQEDIVSEHIALIDVGNSEVDHSNQELSTLVSTYNHCDQDRSIYYRTYITAQASKASVRIPMALSEMVGLVNASYSKLQLGVENWGLRKVRLAESEGQDSSMMLPRALILNVT